MHGACEPLIQKQLHPASLEATRYVMATDGVWSNWVASDRPCPLEICGTHAMQMPSLGAFVHGQELSSGTFQPLGKKQLYQRRKHQERRGNGRHLVRLGRRRFPVSPRSVWDQYHANSSPGNMRVWPKF